MLKLRKCQPAHVREERDRCDADKLYLVKFEPNSFDKLNR